ncbi:MAG: SprT family zinc-dependent metalloprotease [Pseudomonadota bacterium]
MTLRVAVGTRDVTLTAPVGTSDTELSRFLSAEGSWIQARLDALPKPNLPKPGDTLEVLGEAFTLQEGGTQRVKRDGSTLLVPGEDEVFRTRLRSWVKSRAKKAGTAACDRYCAKLGVSYQRLSLRDPRSRWGSCTSEGYVMLSWRLALAPRKVFDYVAAHEVAHLRELHHGPAFWETVERLMPDFEKPRAWLKDHGPELHAIRI